MDTYRPNTQYQEAPWAEGCIFPDLQPDEKLLLVVRRHWVVLVIVALYSLVFVFITFAALILIPITNITPLFVYLTIIITWFFGSQFLFIKWIDYELDFFLLSDKRIIGFEQIGFLNRKTVQASIDQVQEVFAVHKGLFANLLHYGELHVQTASETTELILPMVAESLETSRKMHNFIDRYRHTVRRADTAPPTPKERINQLLSSDQ